YRQKILGVNYTMYNVQQTQDVINPGTAHQNIMVLSTPPHDYTSGGQQHHYWYAQVLGISHANVAYVGSDMVDYNT
ncbi:hypothetical protein SERLA73DRAFT_47334, partial [Serpula lacrymans var. lacrymans S7.3]